MASMNKVMLIAHLGSDPELRYTDNGTPVCQLSVATSRSYKRADGKKIDETEWHRIVVWGKNGEACNEHLSKGRQVSIEGRLRTSAYTDNEGVARRSTEIVADRVLFLGKVPSRDGVSVRTG